MSALARITGMMSGEVASVRSDIRSLDVEQGFFKRQVESFAKKFTVANIIRQTGDVAGPAGALFNLIADRIEERETREQVARQDQARFVKSFLEGTDAGRQLLSAKGEIAAIQEGIKLYERKLAIEKEIDQLREKQKFIRNSGIENANLAKRDLDRLSSLQNDLQNLIKSSEDSDDNDAVEEVETPRRVVNSVSNGRNQQMNVLYDLSTEQLDLQKELNKEVEDLYYLNVEQKEILDKIRAQGETSLEDKLEARAKKNLTPLFSNGRNQDRGEGNSLFSGLMGALSVGGGFVGRLIGPIIAKISGVFATILGPGSVLMRALGPLKGVIGVIAKIGSSLLPILAKVMPILGSLGLAGAAGFAGFKVGQAMNDFMINPFIRWLTGDESATLGTALFDVVEYMKTLPSKLSEAFSEFWTSARDTIASVIDWVKELPGKIVDGIRDAVLNFNPIDYARDAIRNSETIQEARDSIQGVAENIQNSGAVQAATSFFSRANAARESITSELLDRIEALRNATAVSSSSGQSGAPAAIITNQVNNNSGTTIVNRPPIRPDERSWAIENSYFVGP